MRISWLSAEEIAAARQALTANGATWDDHFDPEFAIPAMTPAGTRLLDWDRVTEHVARAERVSEVVREHGLDAARARFGAIAGRDRGGDAGRRRPRGRQARSRSGDRRPALRDRHLRVLRAVPRADDPARPRPGRAHGPHVRGVRRGVRARARRAAARRRRGSVRSATGSPTSTSARAGSTRPRRCSSAATTRTSATSRWR